MIHFSKGLARMTYMNTLTDIVIFPDLHRNTIKFMGIGTPMQYLATKIIGDYYIALERNGVLTTWNLVNGKLIKHEKLGQEYHWLQFFDNHISNFDHDKTFTQEDVRSII